MRRWMRLIGAALAAVLCCAALVLPACAEEAPQVSVPVTVSLTGTLPRPAEKFTIRLKADDPAYPMPEGSVEGEYTMEITGADTKSLPPIVYNRVGIYTYKITQDAGKHRGCKYDATVYYLTVYITNAEDGSGLEATAVLYPNGQGEKVESVEFRNAYPVVRTTPTGSPKTGDTAQPLLYIGLVVLGLGILAALIATRKPRHSEET